VVIVCTPATKESIIVEGRVFLKHRMIISRVEIFFLGFSYFFLLLDDRLLCALLEVFESKDRPSHQEKPVDKS
jgi:hypothetical protein